jgi:S-adenosylmethionine/arginine decarboxylase-like enzyme
MRAWGKHLILDLRSCNRLLITCPNNIVAFSKDLVQRIDMIPYGEPTVKHFGSGNKTGYTLVQLIETSNITGHFCDESGDAYLDVFSCKDFHEKDVIDSVRKYFNPRDLSSTTLFRGRKEPPVYIPQLS